MINYNNGKIYRIINTQNETVYIGSTCQSLSQRLATHKHRGNGNKIILIENYPCDSCEELRMREQVVIEEHKGLLNKHRAIGSLWYDKKFTKDYNREYHEKNKEKISERQREYREKNKEKRNEKKKEKVICEFCGSEVRKDGLKKHQTKAKKCLAHQH